MSFQCQNNTGDNKLSIAHKLRRMVMMVSGIALLVAALTYSIYGVDAYYDATVLRLSSMSKIMGINSAAALSFDDKITAEQLLSALKVETDIKLATIFDAQGKLFAQFARESRMISDDYALTAYIVKGSSGVHHEISSDQITIISDIVFDGEIIGYIEIASSLTPLYENMAKSLLLTIILLGVGFVIVYWLAERLQRQFTGPVEALVEGMEMVSVTQDYDLKLNVLSNDELGRLTNNFNDMLQQLKKRDEALKVKTEETMLLALKAEQANKAKSRFLANMSHEIRTPLNGVIGLIRRMGKLPLQPEEARSYLNNAGQASNDLLALLNDILDFSKMEADSLQLESAAIQMESFVQSSLISLVPLVEEKDISLTANIQGAPTTFIADPLRLRQILINLVGNAVKFTHQGGVSVCIGPCASHQNETDEWLEISVADTGIGMSDEQLERIFGAFSQADESTTRKYGGTGLGLNIAKRLIEIMGGELRVDSREGQGSTFVFCIPVRAHPAAKSLDRTINFQDVRIQPTHHTECDIHFNGERILFAEDNEINQLVAKEELEEMGLNVYVVGNGREALELWQQGDFDLILMDVHMPEMDGLEATRRIRRLDSGGDVPIVALTANAMREDYQRCLDAGMNAYLTKPFVVQELAETLDRYLCGKSNYLRKNSNNSDPSCNAPEAEAYGGAVVAESERSLTQAVGQPESRGGESGGMPLLPLLHEMLINESYILQYKKSGATMLKYLRDGILGQLQCLDQAVQAEAWGEYALIAHKMVGSCILIEGDELPNLLRSMQACGAAGRSEACRERLEILRPYIYKISEEAGNHLKRIE